MSFPKAKKRFGQNFLNNKVVINEITKVINVQQDDIILEIGPGTGALTKNIIPLCKEITLIEIDFGLAMLLKRTLPEQQKINILNIDALDFNPTQFMKNRRFRLVGNLPYNISTPLIFHFLSFSPAIRVRGHDKFFALSSKNFKFVEAINCRAPRMWDSFLKIAL